MNDDAKRRLARNEVLFREANEAIERGQWPDNPAKPVRFRCECSNMECNEAVELTLAEYEQVRRFPRRFVIVAGHEIPDIEAVVARADGHVVVEKRDTAGETAAAADPRS
jgi:hypothetical protein